MTEHDRQDGAPPPPPHFEADPTDSEVVVLPEHASAYFSPRSPPAALSHDTIETEAVRLAPNIDPDQADTRPIRVESVPPPAWHISRVDVDSPTVLIPAVRARRQLRTMGGVAAIWFVVLVLAAVRWLQTDRSDPVLSSASAASSPTARTVPVAAPAPLPVPVTITAPAPSALAAVAPPPAAPANSLSTTDDAAASATASTRTSGTHRSVSSRPRPAPRASEAWLDPGPPKAWLK
ncbi:MAG TPA: hypothetical protein VH142_14175 [Polyangiaceae bacterium]|jgi:hypothetical protein|nr:hypothetical protein [Polyangiaceae bacterium]